MIEDLALPVAPVAWDEHEWRPRVPEAFSRREVIRQTGTYFSAVVPSLSTVELTMKPELAALVDEATSALASFDAEVRTAAGSASALPPAAVLLRTESASSSQIEQLTTSAKQLALAQIDEPVGANASTVNRNVRAMRAALDIPDELSVEAVLTMHRALIGSAEEQLPLGQVHVGGELRRELVWIGGTDSAGPRGAEYVAPQAELVEPAMVDLMEFVRRDDVPRLVHAAVAHAHFETIHPFTDGNGRTGRALVHAMLRSSGLVSASVVPLSAGLLRDTAEYFKALEAYRAGDAGPIVTSFAQAALFAVHAGRFLMADLASEVEKARQKLEGVRPQAAAWKVVSLLQNQPIVNAKFLVHTLGITEMTAGRALAVLTKRGVVREVTGKSRNRIWQHDGILDTLDSFGKRSRRG